MLDLKEFLEFHYKNKTNEKGLFEFYDPLQVAKKHNNDVEISLACALFAYGSAKMIVKFLNSLDFGILSQNEDEIKKFIASNSFKYRFQNSTDVSEIFITLRRIKSDLDIQDAILKGFNQKGEIIDGINELIKEIYKINTYKSDGYEFFFLKPYTKAPTSAYKRYNMFLRWMVRDKDIDLGLFKKLNPKDLLLPLDTHTFKVSKAIGLCNRNTPDFKCVMQITNELRKFDKDDPIKYDFSLYRISQLNEFKGI